jgi:hypothetical protein
LHVKISVPGHDEIAIKLLIKKLKNDKRTKEALTNSTIDHIINNYGDGVGPDNFMARWDEL